MEPPAQTASPAPTGDSTLVPLASPGKKGRGHPLVGSQGPCRQPCSQPPAHRPTPHLPNAEPSPQKNHKAETATCEDGRPGVLGTDGRPGLLGTDSHPGVLWGQGAPTLKIKVTEHTRAGDQPSRQSQSVRRQTPSALRENALADEGLQGTPTWQEAAVENPRRAAQWTTPGTPPERRPRPPGHCAPRRPPRVSACRAYGAEWRAQSNHMWGRGCFCGNLGSPESCGSARPHPARGQGQRSWPAAHALHGPGSLASRGPGRPLQALKWLPWGQGSTVCANDMICGGVGGQLDL